jgi:HAD superfamily hydrolase (TIGR01662 family)
VSYAVVVPTVGRRSLQVLIDCLGEGGGPLPEAIVVVDDRPGDPEPLEPYLPGLLCGRLQVLRSGGRGPAAARNAGWRAVAADWVVFVDDDLLLPRDWPDRLAADLARLGPDVAGSQARVRVPLPHGRRPTDAERNTAGLAAACWITAEMAYRRAALVRLGGFDERFTRTYREDADLALRALTAGYRLVRGEREVVHPVRAAGRWSSLRAQAGNADDALMRRKHGPGWQERAGAGRGGRPWHLVTVLSALVMAGAGVARRPRLAATAGAGWLVLTVRFAGPRIAAGPRTRDEVGTMLATSVLIPPAATCHWLRGLWRHRGARRWQPPPRAVLLDRDGTLVHDVPYNGDPALVRPVAGARVALDRLRDRGIRLAVVSNQSGIGRGRLTESEVDAVNRRVAELLGPFDAWAVCPHTPQDGCGCRKPAPGMVHKVLADLGVPAGECAMIGDIGADIDAARAAGARAVLVPTAATRRAEVRQAPEAAPDLAAAVDLLLGEVRP